MCCFQPLLLPFLQYFCNIFQYFQYIFCTFFVLSEYWKNKGSKLDKKRTRLSTLRAPAQTNMWFSIVFLTEMHITKTQKNRGRIFLLFKYFLDNLFLTVFVQNVISKFVKVLPQKLNNSLLENRGLAFVQQFLGTVCAKFKVYHLKSFSVHHTEIFYQRNSSNHENCNCKYL